MEWILLLLVVHLLCWSTVGICLAPGSGIARWQCALISVVLPIIGAMALLAVGLSRPRRRRIGEVMGERWRQGCWVGVGISAGILVASWMSWLDVGAVGEVAQFSHERSASTDSLPGAALTGTAIACVMAGFCFLGWHYARRSMLIGFSVLATIPATIGLVVIAVGEVSQAWREELDNWLNSGLRMLVTEACEAADIDEGCGEALAHIDTFLSVHEGAYLGAGLGVAALIWAFVWSLRPSGSVGTVATGVPPASSIARQGEASPYDDAPTRITGAMPAQGEAPSPYDY